MINKETKIIAPVKTIESIYLFAKAGAKEFYGGVIDDVWDSILGQYIEMNRRSSFGLNANFLGIGKLCEAVHITNDLGCSFHLTLNALQIPQAYFSILEKLLIKFRNAGGKYVIISDATLISLVRSCDLSPVISSCSGVINVYSARFYQNQGCSRIIFPRDISLIDMESICKNVQNIEYEAFLMNGACRFRDECCLCLHGTSNKGLCDSLDYSKYQIVGDTSDNVNKNHMEFKKLLYRACGQCALFRLNKYNNSLKIVERNASVDKILSDINLTVKNLKIANLCNNEDEYLENMVLPEDHISRCYKHRNCYYQLE